MSSGLLYLVIVGVWACVLVPLWVRRSDAGEEEDADPEDLAPEPWVRPHPRILARRRRRLAGTVGFLLVTVVVVAAGLAPWWSIAVPAVTLLAYLACLRAAAAYDAELVEQDLASEGQPEREPGGQPGGGSGESQVSTSGARAGEHAAGDHGEESRVIDFPVRGTRPPGWSGARDELFDQYADPPSPAVGD